MINGLSLECGMRVSLRVGLRRVLWELVLSTCTRKSRLLLSLLTRSPSHLSLEISIDDEKLKGVGRSRDRAPMSPLRPGLSWRDMSCAGFSITS